MSAYKNCYADSSVVYVGDGNDCGTNTAVDTLLVNARLTPYSDSYMARRVIVFGNSFESSETDEFETDINAVSGSCSNLTGIGTITRLLEEMEQSGFITPYIPFKKTQMKAFIIIRRVLAVLFTVYRTCQRYTGGAWLRQYGKLFYKTWGGFAFESVCQKHILQIRRRLGIEGPLTHTATWRHVPGKGAQAAQIDLLLNRDDRCINICEIKFLGEIFVIDKKYAGELDTKVNVFHRETSTKKTLFPTMITTYATRKNEYYFGRIQPEIVMEDLFT